MWGKWHVYQERQTHEWRDKKGLRSAVNSGFYEYWAKTSLLVGISA